MLALSSPASEAAQSVSAAYNSCAVGGRINGGASSHADLGYPAKERPTRRRPIRAALEIPDDRLLDFAARSSAQKKLTILLIALWHCNRDRNVTFAGQFWYRSGQTLLTHSHAALLDTVAPVLDAPCSQCSSCSSWKIQRCFTIASYWIAVLQDRRIGIIQRS